MINSTTKPLWQVAKAFIITTLVILFLSSCASGDINVRILTNKDANNNSPIRVDLVIVYSKKLFKEIRDLNSTQWFQQKRKYLNGFPGQIVANQWELIPGQVIAEDTLTFSKTVADGIIIFANYPAGDNRFVLENFKSVTIILKQKGMEVQQ